MPIREFGPNRMVAWQASDTLHRNRNYTQNKPTWGRGPAGVYGSMAPGTTPRDLESYSAGLARDLAEGGDDAPSGKQFYWTGQRLALADFPTAADRQAKTEDRAWELEGRDYLRSKRGAELQKFVLDAYIAADESAQGRETALQDMSLKEGRYSQDDRRLSLFEEKSGYERQDRKRLMGRRALGDLLGEAQTLGVVSPAALAQFNDSGHPLKVQSATLMADGSVRVVSVDGRTGVLTQAQQLDLQSDADSSTGAREAGIRPGASTAGHLRTAHQAAVKHLENIQSTIESVEGETDTDPRILNNLYKRFYDARDRRDKLRAKLDDSLGVPGGSGAQQGSALLGSVRAYDRLTTTSLRPGKRGKTGGIGGFNKYKGRDKQALRALEAAWSKTGLKREYAPHLQEGPKTMYLLLSRSGEAKEILKRDLLKQLRLETQDSGLTIEEALLLLKGEGVRYF